MSDEFSHFQPGTRILVTGATGFTGQVLVDKLVRSGAKVRCIARQRSKIDSFSGLDIEWIRGEVFDPLVCAEAIKGVEYLFHVAAAFREPGITDDVYEKVHVASTQELAKLAVREQSFKRFVHVSTVGVHGHIDDPPANESYRFSPGDIYQRTKARAEEWIAAFARESGLPITIVRPAAIYGPGDRRLLKIFKMACRPVFPLFGNGEGLYHLVHVDDLTDIFIRAALHPSALGEVFIAGNPQPSRLRDIVTSIAKALDRSPPTFVRLPSWPLFLLADLCEAVCKPLGIAPPLYRRRAAFFTKDRAFDTSKLRDVLGYVAKKDVASGLTETARWYRANHWL